ncbi:MAG: tRNA pseudouridine(38-40) synthase TruA [Planctomycetes bacterium]|nr:tRNA pseudouridine(38-40) synthase TruA [Planctomycetota bacterium]
MRNIRLTISYDGTGYVGWQVQPNGVSVQSAIAAAIRKLTGETVSLIAASRTDSGVHAVGQVANFHTNSAIPVQKFRPGLQHFLPDDIAVRDVIEVPEDFHATYSARKKWYRYVIHNSRIHHPFLNRYSWRVAADLDVAAMQDAAAEMTGTHDFRCFESHFPNKATSVRTVSQATVSRQSECPLWDAMTGDEYDSSVEAAGDFIWFDVAADGFLYNMVRAMTGTLYEVGCGRRQAADVRRIITDGDRSAAGQTAPPQGLFLMRVDYEGERVRE